MRKEIKIIEVYNPKEKDIEEKLNEAFIIYLAEKLINTKKYNNPTKDIEKSCKTIYNRDSWIGGTYCYRKESK